MKTIDRDKLKSMNEVAHEDFVLINVELINVPPRVAFNCRLLALPE